MTNLLFVCRYNRFRSVIAEAYFNKINKNKSIHVKSAGPIRGNPIEGNVVRLAKSYGLKIKARPQGLTSKLMKWQNFTIIVADDVPESLFDKNKEYGKKVLKWNIRDAHSNSYEEVERIAKMIMKRVDELVKTFL